MTPAAVVIDSSVAVKWLLPEPGTDRALALRDEIVRGRRRALAPAIIHAELANALWKRVAFTGMESRLAASMLAAFRDVPIELVSCDALALPALELACSHRRSVYDCLFLALSVAADAPLVTADESFYNALRPSFPRLSWLD